MLNGAPAFSHSADQAAIDMKQELSADDGVVMATQLPAINRVKLDCSAVLRIVKHARDFAPHKVHGDLLGVQLQDCVEVSSALPVITTSMYNAGGITEEERDRRDADDAERTLKLMRESGMGGLVVGRYAGASQSSYFSAHNIKEMMRGAVKGNPCLLIVYDPLRSQFGKLYLRAFTPTPAFLQRTRVGGDAKSHALPAGTSLLREVPVAFDGSVLAKMVLYQHFATKPRNVTNVVVENGSIEQYNEKTLQLLMEGMEKLRGDLVSHSYANADGVASAELKMETQILCHQLTEQADHLACVSKGASLNVHFASLSTE